jgi:hypothetical protein
MIRCPKNELRKQQKVGVVMRTSRFPPMALITRSALVWLGAAFSAACQDSLSTTGGIQVSEADSSGITVVTITGDVSTLPVWDVSAEPVAEVSGNEPPFLGSIGEVAFFRDGAFLVEDNQTDELRLFDSTGSLVRLIGGAGSGPGEFRSLTKLNVMAGDTFVTYDRRLYRISVFDPDGELMKTVTLTREEGGQGTLALDAWGFGPERFLLHRMSRWDSTDSTPRPRRSQSDAVLFPLDGDGVVDGPPIRFTGGYSVQFENGGGSSPFANQPRITVNSGRLAYGSGLEYELRISSDDLRTRRIVRWSGWKRPLSAETLGQIRAQFETGWEEVRAAQPDLVESLVGALFSPEILPDTLPVLGPVFLDHAGRLWVSRFIPSVYTWGDEDSWHVLDVDGHPQARIQLPPDAQLVAVRGDRVALVMRDSLDVEHLKVFRIPEASLDPPQAGSGRLDDG